MPLSDTFKTKIKALTPYTCREAQAALSAFITPMSVPQKDELFKILIALFLDTEDNSDSLRVILTRCAGSISYVDFTANPDPPKRKRSDFR